MDSIADINSAEEFTIQANAIQRLIQVDVERIAGSYIMGNDSSAAAEFQRAFQHCIEDDAMAASLESTLQQQIEEQNAAHTYVKKQWMLYEIGGVRYIVTVDMQLFLKAVVDYERLGITLDYPMDIWIVSILPELKRQKSSANRLNK